MTSENQTATVAVEASRNWREELGEFWRQLPGKPLLGTLLLAWLLLFQFMGNSTLGYTQTTSLYGWTKYVYDNSPDDQHGYLIPFVVLGLLWWKRSELIALPKRCWWPALGLLVVALLLHTMGFLIQQTRISIVAFFVGMYALTGLVWGWGWLKATFFPFFLFGFCMPLGSSSEFIAFPLRMLATKLTVALAHGVLDINVIRQGTKILEPTGRFQYEVAAACGGIRSLTAIFALTVIFSFVVFRKNWKRAVMIGSSLPLAVLGNVVRLLAIIIAGQLFGQDAGTKVHDNFFFSLLPYVPSILGVVLLARWLKEDKRPEPVAAGQGAAGLGGRPAWGLVLAAGLAVIGLGGWFVQAQQARIQLGRAGVKVVAEPMMGMDRTVRGTNVFFLAGKSLVYLPPDVLNYKSLALPVDKVTWDWLPKDTTYGIRAYQAPDGFRVENQVVLMGADRTSIHQPQYCLVGGGWQIKSTETTTVLVPRPRLYELPVTKILVSRQVKNAKGEIETHSGVFVYWFVADNTLTTDHARRMWSMAKDVLTTGVLQRWAYVICFAQCAPGQETAAYERMKGFLAASVPEYQLTVGPPATVLTKQ